MNEQNIMENNEVIGAAEDVVTSRSGLGLKLGLGALAIGGAIYGGRKLLKKLRAKKEEDEIIEVAEGEIIDDKNVEVEEETKSNKKKK